MIALAGFVSTIALSIKWNQQLETLRSMRVYAARVSMNLCVGSIIGVAAYMLATLWNVWTVSWRCWNRYEKSKFPKRILMYWKDGLSRRQNSSWFAEEFYDLKMFWVLITNNRKDIHWQKKNILYNFRYKSISSQTMNKKKHLNQIKKKGSIQAIPCALDE